MCVDFRYWNNSSSSSRERGRRWKILWENIVEKWPVDCVVGDVRARVTVDVCLYCLLVFNCPLHLHCMYTEIVFLTVRTQVCQVSLKCWFFVKNLDVKWVILFIWINRCVYHLRIHVYNVMFLVFFYNPTPLTVKKYYKVLSGCGLISNVMINAIRC